MNRLEIIEETVSDFLQHFKKCVNGGISSDYKTKVAYDMYDDLTAEELELEEEDLKFLISTKLCEQKEDIVREIKRLEWRNAMNEIDYTIKRLMDDLINQGYSRIKRFNPIELKAYIQNKAKDLLLKGYIPGEPLDEDELTQVILTCAGYPSEI